MAWAAVRTWVSLEPVTDTLLNAQIRGNMREQEAYLATAKGDIYAATAANALTRIAAAVVDSVLVADSTATPGMAWKTMYNKGMLYGNPDRTLLWSDGSLYTAPSYNTVSATENAVGIYVSHPFTVRNLYVHATSGAGSPPGSLIFTLRKNNADTTLTVTMSASEFFKSDLVNSVSFVPGDFMAARMVTSGGGGAVSVRVLGWSIQTETALSV